MRENTFQNIFVKTVVDPSDEVPSELSQLMKPIGNLTIEKVIQVYSNDYKYRLLGALQEKFETVWMVCGDEDFEELVFEYISLYPSTDFDLNFYGDQFPDFLQRKAELMESIPFISELANFEISFWDVFHSQNPEEFHIEQFTQEKILNSYFQFSQHTKLLKYDYNIFPLFQYKDKTLDDFFTDHDQELVLKDAYYILHKKNHKIFCENISLNQYNFLNSLNEKVSLLDGLNISNQITQDEIQELFKLISINFLRNLKELS